MAFVHPGGQLTLMPPPQGYVSNFVNPERQYTENLYYVSGVLAGLTILFMAQRLYINVWVSRTFALEDALLFAGWVSAPKRITSLAIAILTQFTGT